MDKNVLKNILDKDKPIKEKVYLDKDIYEEDIPKRDGLIEVNNKELSTRSGRILLNG